MLRQNRSLLCREGTVMLVVPEFTSNSCPVTAFCGSPPSAGGLNRGSHPGACPGGRVQGIHRSVEVRLFVGESNLQFTRRFCTHAIRERPRVVGKYINCSLCRCRVETKNGRIRT